MGWRGRSARWGRTSAGCSSGRQAWGWVAMAAPGRVVLWPTVAGLPCRRLWRGWDHTSIPRSGVGCLPRWEGSSCGWWPRRRRGIEAGQHRGQAPGLMRSSPLQPGSLLLIGDRSTTSSSGIPQRRQPHPREWRLSSRVVWDAACPSPGYGSAREYLTNRGVEWPRNGGWSVRLCRFDVPGR
jgi:hypothetical protein